ncbi:MAG: bifunctional 2-polyprenyl-6-hydroxyphenol methylase/3-demethylubiquinol 3-O-methyltransferase UbiG [Alphaproteobacteria bacterium]|jgi:2-polyprenyl-6-hydroxyphenyl methylase/3-demethylubiquinone-9 3-methyltransferase|nr:bifunctional 2-polyprenyl-6-hydroxyphenol methylase/3-demethylubiquinol 3-O-methyltransferase UbiG [Alphaproteobacteria bacterium]MDP6590880.1 bifunctional 2-polyprenyl-6-hydroxyphenol methylase/3-demethylubiquinol 3-O-methyltransferase UbiG [Alphaproteobacteria bacterium]MDP6818699.1 bifunctional 2-polyprenyl-6-hydroxyphenol methylase/3-demethylubiquinol 3-O-methyltransferase UbiG [Alphaproteobacteria bacterium]
MTQENSETPGGASVEREEIARFAALAEDWWRPDGSFRALHALNIPRLTYIRDRLCRQHGRDIRDGSPLAGLSLLDIGCGGGLIAEPLARLGAEVTAIDAGGDAIEAARLHAGRSGLDIDYRRISAEELAAEDIQFDCVLTLEVVEHVADLESFLAASAQLVRPGGMFFAATLNRTAASYLLGIVAAERILRWVPPGMHQWSKFVRPSELVASLRSHGVAIDDISGLTYDPLSRAWALSRKVAVNYIASGTKKI